MVKQITIFRNPHHFSRKFNCEDGYRIGAVANTRIEFSASNIYHDKNVTKIPLMMCVVNQRSGNVIFSHKFPLYELHSVWIDLKRHLKNVSPGRIVVLHAESKSINGLRNATSVIKSKGSVLVEHLEDFAVWTLVYVQGGKTLFENLIGNRNSKEHYTSSHKWFSLSTLDRQVHDGHLEKRRWQFCDRHGVMGDLCDEFEPANIGANFDYQNVTNIIEKLDSIPVIITAGSRTSYLYQSLKSYINADGVLKKNFHVFLGTDSNSTKELLYLLNITYTFIPPSQYLDTEFFSLRYYGEVYQDVYNTYENATFVIFLEEDIEVSPDFFNYIAYTISLLEEKDENLYCIAGFSATGLMFLAHDESVLMRGDVQVGWGYAVKRTFILEALKTWPVETNIARVSQYDAYLYNSVRKGRECILPEVSRTRHFGMGMNTNYLTTEKVFLTQPVAKTVNISYTQLQHLRLKKWDDKLKDEIKRATTIDPITQNICQDNYLKTLPSKSYAIYYNCSETEKNSTYFNFYALANCFKSWPYSKQGQHDAISTMKLAKDKTVYLIEHPTSSFSSLMPKNMAPFDMRHLSPENYFIYVRANSAARKLEYMTYENSSMRHMIKNLFS